MTGEEVIKVRDALKGQRAPFEPHWNELAEVYTPFNRVAGSGNFDLTAAANQFDSTGRASAEIYANGICSLIIPREDVWFEYGPPKSLRKDDEAVKWLREASEEARDFMESSNLYEEIQESVIESPVFGTCSIYVAEIDDDGEGCFLHLPIGTYYIGEDAKGRVRTIVRDLSYTANQAAEEFGKDALPREISSKVGSAAGMTEKFDFIHLVTKRIGPVERDAPEALKRPWTDIVVAVKSKTVVRRSGILEFPFPTHRYRKYGKSPYGFGPGSLALGDSRQASFLSELGDLGTEKEVFPPLLAAASLEGEVAQGALEVTYFEEGTNTAGHNSVKELHPTGRLQTLQWRTEAKQKAIERAFHVDLFKLFSNRVQERGPLTATEANLVAGEKLTQFSPVYGRFMSEMIGPLLMRVFSVLYRAGRFGQAPASLLKVLGDGKTQLIAPTITYRNRIALAMKAKENGALMEFFSLMLPTMQAFPQLAELIWTALEGGVMIRDVLRNSGTPERWIASLKDIAARQQATAEAREKQATMEQAEVATGMAKNIAAMPPGVTEQLQQQQRSA